MYHEIYGKYYKLITKLLNSGPKTEKYINDYIQKYGFDETILYLNANELLNTYHLYYKKDNIYYPIIKNKIPKVYTNEQLGLIKLIINDEKANIFLNKEDINNYNNIIKQNPLFDINNYHYINQDIDKDNIDRYYSSKFNKIIEAINNNKDIKIIFKSNKNNITYKKVIPFKIEYSMQDQKFRLVCIQYRNSIIDKLIKIRISSIKDVKIVEREVSIDINEYINNQNKQYIEIEVYPELNGIERVFIELSNYKREAMFDNETNTSKMKIYYEESDIGELIIKLLSFGKVIKILTPGLIKDEVIKRIKKQKEYFS